jgi:hypothetical protein
MRRKEVLIIVLIFILTAVQIFANNFSDDGVTITWGETWVHIDNSNTNGVIVYFSVELSNGKFEHSSQPIAGDTPWQWNTPSGIKIVEMRSISVTKR